MTLDEMIVVLQAAKDGKKIQKQECKFDHSREVYPWKDLEITPSTPFDFSRYRYRVKRMPREFLLVLDDNGHVIEDVPVGYMTGRPTILVREVLES